jgi:hypothetical protein
MTSRLEMRKIQCTMLWDWENRRQFCACKCVFCQHGSRGRSKILISQVGRQLHNDVLEILRVLYIKPTEQHGSMLIELFCDPHFVFRHPVDQKLV